MAAGGGGAEATARLAAAAAADTAGEASRHGRDAGRGIPSGEEGGKDRIGSLPADAAGGSSSGRAGNGGRGGKNAQGAAGAAAGSGGRLGREVSRRQRRRHPLAPEHRATLKRAVSALREPSGGGGGGGDRRRNGSGSPRRGGGDEGRREGEGEQAHGGLRASELSAFIYAMRRPRHGGDDGPWDRREVGERSDSEEEDDWADGRTGERGAWEQGVACSREDFEEILLELEAEGADSDGRR